jgi:hypothetical protein
MKRRVLVVFAGVLLAAGPATATPRQGQTPQAGAAGQAVPKTLRPLLQPKQSEMRLVVLRYTLDRAALSGNFLGAPRGGPGGGRGAGTAAPTPAYSSSSRIARLKRFDLDWQSALGKLDATRLSPAAKSDFDALAATVTSNLKRLDDDSVALAQAAPILLFAPAIVQLVESRIRLESLDPEKAAGTLTAIGRQIAAISSRVEAGLGAATTPDALRVGKDLATRGAAATDTLRSSLSEWFTFYNGYDPLFTWWVGVPFKKVDAALQGYAALLKDKAAAADLGTSNVPTPAISAIAPAAAPKFPSVPDLAEIISLPQDEMSAIVQRFRGSTGRGGRGGDVPPSAAAEGRAGAGRGDASRDVAGRAGNTGQAAGARASEAAQGARGAQAGQPPVVRDKKFYQDWLAALKTLNFDTLSRNAQVDYLFIKKTAEQQIARVGVSLPASPPRKTDASGIPGAARGRQGLIFDLHDDLIPYTPEELIALAEKEFAWCDVEMKKASRQMGFGDDWKRAIEKVKEIHPPPGGQVGVVRDLMFEAVDYLRAKDLLTVPAVAAESLHMIMMTPERQLVNPFFLGGSLITVSYPTDTMEYDARIQSMRGNNTPFSHATAFHEMIPGHNLVGYVNARYAGYRASLGSSSPFYSEGWPLYWELLMYDMGFHDTPEKKVGALFWRMHRCARIIFSLKFHMGEWSPQECIDFLVDRVAFEPDNAAGEVRRSFQGGYGPLYQAAYLLGGLQLRGLRGELVDSGQLANKQFHDEILRQGNMPIALLRLVLGKQKLTRDTIVDWKFYGEIAGK